MTSKNEYHPDEVSPPGSILAELSVEREMSLEQLTQRLNAELTVAVTAKYVAELIKGDRNLSYAMAKYPS